MKDNLQQAIKFVAISEGAYSNDAHDPGGPTDLGVTQKEYNAYRRCKRLAAQSVRYITASEMQDIFGHQYWDAVKADELTSGVDYIVADDAYNSGPHQAIKNFQRALNDVTHHTLDVDGVIGLLTLEAVHDADPRALIEAYVLRRMGYYRMIPGWRYFATGWTKRIYGDDNDPGVRKNALSLLEAKSS